MAVALRQSRRFGKASPVTRYWVANCVGFKVTGGSHGVVEAVHAEDDPNAPDTIVVRCGKHRTRSLPATAVHAVVPSERVLVVEHVPGSFEIHGTRAMRALVHSSVFGARVGARLCALGWTLGCRGWAAASPHVRRAGAESARLIASVPWRRSARSALSATASLCRTAWRSSWDRRTTSSRLRSGNDSSPETDTTSST